MGRQRIEPGPGEESVWDYPRPPKLEDSEARVKIVFGDVTLAYTSRAKRVLEMSHPPVYYVPPEDIRMEYLKPSDRTSLCEFKGRARYYDVVTDEREEKDAAWYYLDPAPGFESLEGYVAFYPSRMDNCRVDGEKVEAQEGDFYGGWITPDVVGPFKGAPGTRSW